MMQNMTRSQVLGEALKQPNGARFYCCALQINPYAYHSRHAKQSTFKNEADYNAAIIAACHANNIEAIAVTDHYRITDSLGLVNAARAAGIFVFGGFEAASNDGVHFLCLYDPDKDSSLERLIGEFGVRDHTALSPNGNKNSVELLKCIREQGGVAIAAHVAADNGLLATLEGQPRISAWLSRDLYACALPGPIGDAPQNVRGILENKDAAHKRERRVAIINASDVNSPEDLAEPRSSCFIKMSALSVEGLRQAFLDPDSRIRLHSDPRPEPHAEFIAMAWEGGFLDGTRLHFNGNLNVLVGGRGTGKSTIIESLRYALAIDPIGEEANKAHQGVLKHVLKSGTKISLLVRSHHPAKHDYTIERTIPNPPVVKDELGNVLNLSPRDVAPGVEIFGQHEISELTKSREKLTLLLERFVERDPNAGAQKAKLRLELERSRGRIADVQREFKLIEERLSLLPSLEETQKRFQDAGLEERLKEKSLLVREERILATIKERLAPVSMLHQELAGLLPIDTAFLSAKALEGLPNSSMLIEGAAILDQVTAQLQVIAGQIEQMLSVSDAGVSALRSRWDERRQAVETTYQALLRELQKSKIDGEEFIRLRRQIEELRPLREKKEALTRDLATYQQNRRNLLDEWINLQSAEYRALEKAAKRVSRKLGGRVRAMVTMGGNREPLEKLLRDEIGGNLAALLERLKSRETLSLFDFAQRCREGKDSLISNYSLPSAAAERLAQADPDIFMRLEELELPATTQVELNTSSEGEPETWQTIEALSTGQKATAVLLLLLLESEAPLVVDQPEDDLDNRFITEGVVPTMKEEKRKRQFVFSTHNANIPVLGDAELIIGLSTTIQNEAVQGRIDKRHMGSIDMQPVREMVEEILEGGKTAFEMRRQKYGF
ncbi:MULTISPECIES: TrlF family AAA-like ATPase [Acidithiobacillus]|uniref:Phosphoesterase n=2 Tax=Acidithiobacillus TaxID=119977 RepID=A0A179BMU1_ACIFR|nr:MULTISPECIES: AAA family ATPase [Acidithiobacillus]MEB8487999.1 AAA family ATPase [Acidithiobacillus ferriphilus]MEB8489404.1 AAA family ATPase [Acidithiobacillus ferriphilus]MEB8493627.1 AAA family ATPase [Acidithiobacillus ferriphilus]MEB8515396.1 AAA family ATPase [Acidithiobacillus ferriphilus]MEB8520481.1 AAA family ATPase [Acidithiobacillus ferriphilus]